METQEIIDNYTNLYSAGNEDSQLNVDEKDGKLVIFYETNGPIETYSLPEDWNEFLGKCKEQMPK